MTAALKFSPGKIGVTGLLVVVASVCTSVTCWVFDASVVPAAVIVVVKAGAGAGVSSKAGAGAGVSLEMGAMVSATAGAGVSTKAGAVAGRSTGAAVVSILSWEDCCTGSDNPEYHIRGTGPRNVQTCLSWQF